MKRAIAAVVSVLAAGAYGQPSSVVNSPHNLSSGGPGVVRAAMEDQVCIFCHAPHNSSPIKPLWNRSMSLESYTIYTSRSLDAEPGQPTGASKMCLSCHDGTIALGSVLSQNSPILMSGGVTAMPAGPGHIGTDLADDHPISFRFDSALTAKDPKLRPPSSMPHELKLDQNSELQCTTCHDAHNNSFGKFLVMRNTSSELCNSCHNMGSTSISAHSNCNSCHQLHTSPSGPYLLKKQTITDTCVACHDGSVPGASNIGAELKRASVHDTRSPVDPPEPLTEHTTCTDCHEPHTMARGSSPAPNVHPNFGRIRGVSQSGGTMARVNTEAEVCFKCHSDRSNIQAVVSRKIAQMNTRLEFGPTAISYHPVENTGRNTDVPSLRLPWTTASVMHCSDCHSSDTGANIGGAGPSGTHGSNYKPLLAARYETADYTPESAAIYALCYQCHDRTNILSNASFSAHKLHIVDQRTPCAACHDSHGISQIQGNITNNSNLMNFAINIAFPDRATGRLEYRDLGRFQGECFLTCHGRVHSGTRYPAGAGLPGVLGQ